MTDTQAPSKDVSTAQRLRNLCEHKERQAWCVLCTAAAELDTAMLGLAAIAERERAGHEPPAEHIPLNAMSVEDKARAKQLLDNMEQRHLARTLEPFVVKHYASDERPSVKGNGFDGLEIGEDREDAERFVQWINQRLSQPPVPDAARYQWLRSHIAPSIISRILGTVNDATRDSRPEALDALIDGRLTLTKCEGQS